MPVLTDDPEKFILIKILQVRNIQVKINLRLMVSTHRKGCNLFSWASNIVAYQDDFAYFFLEASLIIRENKGKITEDQLFTDLT